MNVGQLRAALADVPAEMPVIVAYDSGWRLDIGIVVGVYDDPDTGRFVGLASDRREVDAACNGTSAKCAVLMDLSAS